MAVDVRPRIQRFAARYLADGQGDDCSDDDGNVNEDAERLDTGHDWSRVDADNGVNKDETDIDAVDGAVGGGIGTVAGDGDAGENHKREGVWQLAANHS